MTDETGGLAHLQNGGEAHLGNALHQQHQVVGAAVLPAYFASLKSWAISLPEETFYFKEAAVGGCRDLSSSS